MAVDFTIKQGDTLPALTATLTDSRGLSPFVEDDGTTPLTGYSVRCHIVHARTGSVLVDEDADVDDEEDGDVSYQWQAGDTATAGTYHAEWSVLYASGDTLTFPNNGFNVILIVPALA